MTPQRPKIEDSNRKEICSARPRRRYPGNRIHATDYLDTEDFTGPLRKIFDDAMAFVMRNLHKVQAGRGVNAPGLPEIPESVFEELLVNALVHRDYLVSAPIRLFIFDNRIEIISPGHLPNNLTVEKILTGISNIRNPILVSYVAKGLLPYHGLGSGIKRALDAWGEVEFTDDRDGCLFTATVHRKPVGGPEIIDELAVCAEQAGRVSPNFTEKSSGKIVAMLKENPKFSARQVADRLGVTPRAVEKQIAALRAAGLPASGNQLPGTEKSRAGGLIMREDRQDIIIYNTVDAKASVSLYAKDGMVWMNQNQLAQLFDTSVPNISMHIANILKEKELDEDLVVKQYLTTATDGKDTR